jgi:hypothetical protein
MVWRPGARARAAAGPEAEPCRGLAAAAAGARPAGPGRRARTAPLSSKRPAGAVAGARGAGAKGEFGGRVAQVVVGECGGPEGAQPRNVARGLARISRGCGLGLRPPRASGAGVEGGGCGVGESDTPVFCSVFKLARSRQ